MVEELVLIKKEIEDKDLKHFYGLASKITEDSKICDVDNLIDNVGNFSKVLTRLLHTGKATVTEINQYNSTLGTAKDNLRKCLR